MKPDRKLQQTLIAVVRRLDEALALLDALDKGDGECAASIERAVQRAKRELRTVFGPHTRPLPPLPARLQSARRGSLQLGALPRRLRTEKKS